MPETIRGNILVLDDDATFRSLVKNILETRGFRVIEASSPAEASSLFSDRGTVLAIVDYRLPQIDGMTWITSLRESGKNTPVIFCSAIPCDMKTFNWLRNVLKVSLILQKPIIPSSFVEQVESLLPGYEKVFPQESLGSGTNYDAYSENSASEEMVAEMSKIKRRLEMERAVQKAKLEYIGELDGQWRTLTELIDIHNNDKSRLDVLVEARHISHRIRGTAGSVGLPNVSEIAAKLEDFLAGLDGQEDTQQEVIWSEVIRFLAVGHQAVSVAKSEAGAAFETSDKPSVMVVSGHDDVVAAAGGKSVKQIASIEFANNPAGVAGIFAQQRVDAVFIEMTSDRRTSMQRVTEVRKLPGASALPLGFFSTFEAPLSAVEQLYLGASVNLVHPIEEEPLQEAISQLLSVANPDQPRVLAIDDDEVLCRFVASVLHSERMETRTSTNPLEGLAMIDDFKPDLILLDVMMPALTGFEVCRRIRENRDWENIPIVFLTSKTSAEARSAAFAVGANDFVTKPVLATELINRINSQLHESALKRQVRTRDPETGVLNGDSVMQLANVLLDRHAEYMAPMAVALISINDYDQLALVQGQFSARQAAKALGELLQLRFRAEDLRGRWSDRGYVLVAERCDRELLEKALRILQEDFELIQFGGGAFRFTSSFSSGVSDSYDDGPALEGLIKASHLRMKEAMATQKV
ncbi:MAG: response regulator [Candidatus Melainabacteria bacterium]|nr:response regulator [Candidatus Melainabacteria bacterium]